MYFFKVEHNLINLAPYPMTVLFFKGDDPPERGFL